MRKSQGNLNKFSPIYNPRDVGKGKGERNEGKRSKEKVSPVAVRSDGADRDAVVGVFSAGGAVGSDGNHS